MPTALTRYKVLLSAPGDAEQECKAADDELQKINRTHSNETGIDFYPTDWRRDSRADSGDEPQKLLNRQIVEDADIILAIFKERFGTPTSQYGSGTEEEIMLGLEMGKSVLVYFWNPGPDFVPKDADQYAKIAALRSRLQSRVMYQVFSDEAALRNKITHDFTKLLYELEGGTISPKPQLLLAGVTEDGDITQGTASVVCPIVSNRLNPAAYDDAVQTAYERVLSIKLPHEQDAVRHSAKMSSIAAASISTGLSAQLTSRSPIFSSNPITVTQASRDLVARELESLGLNTADELFDLGELRESEQYIPTGINSSQKMLYGSDVEKQKYEALQIASGMLV